MAPTRILVVDDEPTVAKLAGAVLAQQGYEVWTVTSPAEALALAAGGTIDLVLSDFVMPEMNGPELIRKIQEHSPSTAALLMSGYMTGELKVDIPLVVKPFSAATLVSAISRVLEETRQARQASRRSREENPQLRAYHRPHVPSLRANRLPGFHAEPRDLVP
jgi:two-component system, cell cycle sensor histidine kinase and response regulator CckA